MDKSWSLVTTAIVVGVTLAMERHMVEWGQARTREGLGTFSFVGQLQTRGSCRHVKEGQQGLRGLRDLSTCGVHGG